ncbi:MAG: hypothetical protein M9962_07335 [Oligoflexia bacterium]|nr:hypothetical protein [Oligoflexia bacterium]
MEKTGLSNPETFLEKEPLDFTQKSKTEGKKFSLVPALLIDIKNTWKKEGLKRVLQVHGWKAVAIFFSYYLIRDSILYLLIPYLIAQGIFAN